MSVISKLSGLLRPRALAALIGAVVALSLGGLMAEPAPASADDYNTQGLQPPAYKYRSQYARKSGMYLNLGNLAYVRVPTIRLRTGAVKFREVQAANNGGANFVSGGHFITSVGHFRNGPAQYGKQRRIVVPIAPPYYYRPYGNGGPFYGTPSGYIADYYGQPGYNAPGYGMANGQLGYGGYGFNIGQALQGLPPQSLLGVQPQQAYRSRFNAPVVADGGGNTATGNAVFVPQQLPGAEPRVIHFNGATAKSGAMPIVHKPAGTNLIRVE